MLIYSNDRYIATEVNMMILRAKDNVGYYYVHRGLYDQAVILSDLYGNDVEGLCEQITGSREVRSDVEEFVETMPAPINILGCFLLLVDNVVEEHIDRVGAIHVMSGFIGFRKWIKQPKEVRPDYSFSLSISEEYQLAWDRFFKESIPYDANYYRAPATVPMNGTANVVESVEEEWDEEQAIYNALMDVDDDIFDGADDDPFADSDPFGDIDEEDEETTPAPTLTPDTVIGDPTPPLAKAKTGLEYIRGLSEQ